MSFTTINVNLPFPARTYVRDLVFIFHPYGRIYFWNLNIGEVYYLKVNVPTEEIYNGIYHEYIAGNIFIYDGLTLKGTIPFKVLRGEQKRFDLRPDYYPFTDIRIEIREWAIKPTQTVTIPRDTMITLNLPPFIRVWTCRQDETVIEGGIIFIRNLITSPREYYHLYITREQDITLYTTNTGAYLHYLLFRIYEIYGTPTPNDTIKIELYYDTTKKYELLINLSSLPKPPPDCFFEIPLTNIKPINKIRITPSLTNVVKVLAYMLYSVYM